MLTGFDLVITPNAENFTADLRLLDTHGIQLAYQHADFNTISASHRDGLFNLRNYLELLVEDAKQTEGIAEIGVCIAQEVLGAEIFELLASVATPRTLRVLLPDATTDNALALQLARIPWEIARRALDQPTLAKRNLHIRVVNSLEEPTSEPLRLASNESLRVLFIFAEARGSRPLGARRERRELLQLFKTRIYPKRRVVAHFLSHGVTRERLEAQVRENGGYHIVHWSGHGSQNQLELARPGGGTDHLTGIGLLELFNDAGGRLPQLIFLSACNSGEVLPVQNWQDLLAVAQGQQPVSASRLSEATSVATQLGYTGTAHSLVGGGVPAVVAMRYAVGDVYARELALQFYDALLAYEQPQPVEKALLTARQQLSGRTDQSLFAPCDHVTPVLYGAGQPDLSPLLGRSPALSAHSPRLGSPVPELTISEHQLFVGRTWELAELGADFIGIGAGVKPVALVTGLGGMGKTALTAEALELWEQRFKWVLLYQAKPSALNLELTLRDIHLKLVEESEVYRNYLREHPTGAIHREPTESFTGDLRLERLTRNLVRALQDEPILLVLDNFEANLKPNPEPSPGVPRWTCQNPAWDRCLAQFAAGLGDSLSRVLITCRWPLAALAEETYCSISLGPLPASEAALYVNSHPGLLPMALGADKQEAKLVERLMNASRLHPLLMDRLARLATGGPKLRPQLLDALLALETNRDYSQLPTLFTVERGNKRETVYLEDALTISLDLLIEQAGPDARYLLWMIAIANDSVTLGLLDAVWRGQGSDYQQKWRLKEALADLSQLPPKMQKKLRTMPADLRSELDALQPLPSRPAIKPLLNYLLAIGLVTAERNGPEGNNPDLTCHELVRERIWAWRTTHSQEAGDQTEDVVRITYAGWLKEVCETLLHKDMAQAVEAGRRAIVYYVQAHAYGHLSGLVGKTLSSSNNILLLESLIPYLEQAAQEAPEGRFKWTTCGYLADALRNAGRLTDSLSYYERATNLVHAAVKKGGDSERQAWADLGWLTNNWAQALADMGQIKMSRQQLMESAEAKRKAGMSAVVIIGTELAALRLDVLQGQAKTARLGVEERLTKLQAWWQQHQMGQSILEAPDAVILARALMSALDVARDVDRSQGSWDSSLNRSNAMLAIKRTLGSSVEEIAGTRMNRAVDLQTLGHFTEAQSELESCLLIFATNSGMRAKVLGCLASLFAAQNDFPQAIVQMRRTLAIMEQLPDPFDRALSHNKLASYLNLSIHSAEIIEAPKHRLAALLYRVVIEVDWDLQDSLQSYVMDFQQVHAVDTSLAIPRITELLAAPDFHSLSKWLRERQVDLTELQATVDDFLDQVRQAANETP